MTLYRVDINYGTLFKRELADYISTVMSVPLKVVTVDGKLLL